MKKNFLILLILSFCTITYAQKYQTRTGKVSFNASTSGFEPIKAQNPKSTAILDVSTGNFAALSLVKGFKFDIALMQEHFNERYAESDKYPKAKFTGKFSGLKLSTSEKKYTLKGNLEFHGQKKAVETLATVYQKNGKVYIKGSFNVKPSDFKIKIGSTVTNKVAKEVKISFNYELTKK